MKLIALTRGLVLLTLVVVMVSGCKSDAGDGHLDEVTEATFDAQVLQSELPVLVDFGADWCPPCQKLRPHLVALAAEYAGRFKVLAVDTDKSGALAQRYEISAIPALFVFVGGKQVERVEGYRSEAELRKLLDKYTK